MFEPYSQSPSAGIHLPHVDDCDRDEVLRRFAAFIDELPDVSFLLSETEGTRCRDELARGSGPLTHGEALGLIVPIVETLFDDTCRMSPAFHMQLIMMCQFPSIPESMVLQVAFGRRVGEEQLRKIVRISARARHRGLSVDEYVAELYEGNAVPHDSLVKLFLGESKRIPMAERTTFATELLRTTAALAAEPLRPQILCAIAWLFWARGKRALAVNYLTEACRIDPSHPTARGLIAHFGEHLPAWLG